MHLVRPWIQLCKHFGHKIEATFDEVDGRSDLFAVGATMFRILAKRRIHEANTEVELLTKMAKA